MFHLDGDNKMSPEELLMLVNEVQQDGSIDKDEGDPVSYTHLPSFGDPCAIRTSCAT